MSETVAAGQLRAFIERIERIEADIKELNADKSEVYKEVRGVGFDVKAVRQCVTARKLDAAELEERTALFDLYWETLNGASRVHVHEDSGIAQGRGEGRALQVPVSNPAPATSSHSLPTSSPVTDKAGEVPPPGLASPIQDDEVPAFLRKPVNLRPLCQDPSNCAGYGSHTCHACLKAAESEAA